ncbi:MAG: twin-arginine translocase TatA/TatE family subunit [Bacteroidales bacterium]|nr:twin-arginine translocase TatA/TatE family subunit [Bacteroidales bacterium]
MYLFVLLGLMGGYEIIVIALIVLILFGGKKIPELMKGLGKGIKEFKNATNDSGIKKDIDKISSEVKDVTSLGKK